MAYNNLKFFFGWHTTEEDEEEAGGIEEAFGNMEFNMGWNF